MLELQLSCSALGSIRFAPSLRFEALYGSWDQLALRWPAIRRILDDELHQRAVELADRGIDAVLNDLHGGISWRDRVLRIDAAGVERIFRDVAVLRVVPCVGAWPEAGAFVDRHGRAAIVYPPRGVAALWAPPMPSDHVWLGDLLGRSRARILTELAAPRTTSELAEELGLTAPTVSLHLTVLRRAGLLSRVRRGRAVVYRVNSSGEALLAAGRPRIHD